MPESRTFAMRFLAGKKCRNGCTDAPTGTISKSCSSRANRTSETCCRSGIPQSKRRTRGGRRPYRRCSSHLRRSRLVPASCPALTLAEDLMDADVAGLLNGVRVPQPGRALLDDTLRAIGLRPMRRAGGRRAGGAWGAHALGVRSSRTGPIPCSWCRLRSDGRSALHQRPRSERLAREASDTLMSPCP